MFGLLERQYDTSSFLNLPVGQVTVFMAVDSALNVQNWNSCVYMMRLNQVPARIFRSRIRGNSRTFPREPVL